MAEEGAPELGTEVEQVSEEQRLRAERKIKKYMLSGKDSIAIVVVGNIGTGKSSLVNGIIGKEVAKESPLAFASTNRIERFENQVLILGRKRVRVTVWDTPGLGDIFNEDEDSTMEEIVRVTRKTDLLLYCLDMRRRLDRSEAEGIKKLTVAAGVDIWKHAIFALTFGNKVKPQNKAEDKFGYFTSVYSSWKHALHKLFNDNIHAPEDITSHIAIVPTGYRHKPPPDRVDWFTPFWEASFHKTKHDAQPNLIGANIDRFYLSSAETEAQVGTPNEAGEEEEEDVEPHKMRINLVLRPRVVTAAAAGGMILGSTGVGALIGIAGGPIGVGIGAGMGFGTGVIATAVLAFMDRYSDTPSTPELATAPPLQR